MLCSTASVSLKDINMPHLPFSSSTPALIKTITLVQLFAMIEQTDSGSNDPIFGLVKRSCEMFRDSNPYIPSVFPPSRGITMAVKKRSSYSIPDRPGSINQSTQSGNQISSTNSKLLLTMDPTSCDSIMDVAKDITPGSIDSALTVPANQSTGQSRAVVTRRGPPKVPNPQWHAPWELSAVISGHLGWVRCIAFDPSNEWFVTGSADRTIKVWDLAKVCAGSEGGLKLTLTGHINAIRGLAVSPRHPYLFSVGEDKMVKCWDLEYNKVTRNYHGHLSGVFSVALHPTLDVLITGGRDSVARVWDIRTKHQIHVLGGHGGTVSSIITNAVDPQIVTASHDSTIKLWDLAAGRTMCTLTQHKKAVRALVSSPKELSFVSASADNMKKWQTRDGKFVRNFVGHNAIINSLSANEDGVLVSGGDNGSLCFFDYDTGYCFQKTKTIVQPGSLDAEAGIFASAFDLSGSRLLTCEADKSIKVWKENTEATEDTHPMDMKAWTKQCLALKRY
eukprot:gene907-1761_t